VKIYIPHSDDLKTGKGFFCRRLASACLKMGVNVVVDPSQPHDVSLQISKIKPANTKIRVFRVDGVIHNLDRDYKSANKTIASHLHAANAVVYQSNFSRNMCDRYLGPCKKDSAIILNGDDPSRFEGSPVVPHEHKHNVIASSRWRPHKRLTDIIYSFLEADIADSCLYVAGDISKGGLSKSDRSQAISGGKVKFLGKLPQEELASYYNLCKVVVHLCWFDCCPNSLVEAICAGCVPVTNNTGGNPEICEPAGGSVCQIDKEYNLKPVHLYKPPTIDRSKVSEAIRWAMDSKEKPKTDHIDIKNVARQYLDFFAKLLK